MAPGARTTPSYEKGETCLCYHGPVLYEAKVQESRQEDPKDKKSAWEYLLHYQGWKKTWDEWVLDGRMRKNSDENRNFMKAQHQTQKASQRQAAENRKESKKASKAEVTGKRKSKVADDLTSRPSEERGSSAAPVNPRKRGRDTTDMEKEEDYLSKPAIKIPLPDLLKSMLVDDWEWITKDLKLVPIPHPHPVSEILADYQAHEAPKRRPGSAEADVLEEIVQGVREYFDKSLGRILLYRYERQQWFEINTAMNKDNSDETAVKSVTIPATEDGRPEETVEANLGGKSVSEIYGVEHLCRLFVSMPELIAQTNMDSQSVRKLREELGKMTSWLGKNWKRYETRAYIEPNKKYQNDAKGLA